MLTRVDLGFDLEGGRVADAVEPNPTLARRVLAVRLGRLRDQHGHDLRWLAEKLDVALSQASRLDSGARGYGINDVKVLCAEYQLPRVETVALLALATEARRRAWWQQVDLVPSYRTLIGFEQAATEIAEFCSTIVPGMLQTESYAEASVRYGSPPGDERAASAVSVRMRRQKVLSRVAPPHLAVVIDEAVLARGPERDVMRAQLDHLLAMASLPNIRIQVLPFDRGFYPAGMGQFILLRLPGDLPDVHYWESPVGSSDSDNVEIVKAARSLWNELQGLCPSTSESTELIRRYRDRL